MHQPNPEKDQHILIDEKIIDEEIEVAKLTKKDKVIEIGSGPGNLTRKLIGKAAQVKAFEPDKQFKKELESLKAEIIFDNALKHSWHGYNKIVSNIPYTASEPIIQKAIKDKIDSLVLIVSENFSKTLQSKEKLGLVANLFFEIRIIKKVSKSSFFPEPRIDSALIILERKKKLTKKERILQRILFREGKTKNALLQALVSEGYTKNQAREILLNSNLSDEAMNKPAKKITSKFLILLENKLIIK